MDDATQHALLQILGKAMSDISEDCYCAGWLRGAEYVIPELSRRAVSTGETQACGRWSVTPEQACGLIALADIIGSWANLNETATGYVALQPFPVSAEYVEALEQESAFNSNVAN